MAYSFMSIFGIFWSYSRYLLMDLFLLIFGLVLAYIWTYFCLYMVIFLLCKILILLANQSYSRRYSILFIWSHPRVHIYISLSRNFVLSVVYNCCLELPAPFPRPSDHAILPRNFPAHVSLLIFILNNYTLWFIYIFFKINLLIFYILHQIELNAEIGNKVVVNCLVFFFQCPAH